MENKPSEVRLPQRVLGQSIGFLIQNWRVFLQFALVPLFAGFLLYFCKFLPKSLAIVGPFLKSGVAFLFGAYFSVRWLRFILLQERPEAGVAPLKFMRRDFLYAFMNVALLLVGDTFAALVGHVISMVLTPFGGAGMIAQYLLLFVQGLIAFYISVRLKFVFISIAMDKPIDYREAWQQTGSVWKSMFGYLLLSLLCIGIVEGLLLFLLLMVQDPSFFSAEGMDMKHILSLVSQYSWLTDNFAYLLRALNLTIIATFYLATVRGHDTRA